MATLTEVVASVVLHSSAAIFTHFGVTTEAQAQPPAAEQRVVARSPRKPEAALPQARRESLRVRQPALPPARA